MNDAVLQNFHPAVQKWFADSLGQPTPIQAQAWQALATRQHAVISAPTGEGKTLAAFLAVIDALVKQRIRRQQNGHLEVPAENTRATRVLYVSPLKALSNDIEKNLQLPLAGIQRELKAAGIETDDIHAMVRTGDTSPAERAKLVRLRPEIVVTTPESLYLMLTSVSGRQMLETVETVIVDEIHALAGSRRGSHLLLSLARLESLCAARRERDGLANAGDFLQRIAVSATVKPIEAVARFLVGDQPVALCRDTRPRQFDIRMLLPSQPLTAVMSGEMWQEIYLELAKEIQKHRTTLIFVNNRRLCERLARHLTELLEGESVSAHHGLPPEGVHAGANLGASVHHGLPPEGVHAGANLGASVHHGLPPEGVHAGANLGASVHHGLPSDGVSAGANPGVSAHHGSLSHSQRLRGETLLKEGKLKVMVATSSLELGLDIGTIDLVVQISSPRSIHAFIQRAGRSEHHKNGTSRALLVPLTRDDLSECVALVRALRQGALESLELATPALDILAQQIVAEVAMRDIGADELFALVVREAQWQNLARSDFDAVLEMLNDGYSLRFGRRSRYIFYDKTDRVLRARPGARITAALNGGAIPENFEYEVIDESSSGPLSHVAGAPENRAHGGAFVGTVHEDFAIESSQGDVFQLGNRLWQIRQISGNRVSVVHAPDKHPTIPFWIVDVPGRTDALSDALSTMHELFNGLGDPNEFVRQISAETGLPSAVIGQLADYYRETQASLGLLPTKSTVVLERFFDEVKNCHIVLHSVFGAQVNRAWGLALRKRFCRQFNFELQAAANDNAIILSLSHTHSFHLPEVFSYLKSVTAEQVLIQALLDAPMFEVRWRWNASRALAILRRSTRGKVPAQWQKSGAQDLVALLFPDQIACAENLSGPRAIPDHPLVKQTVSDCLHEAMDAKGFVQVLQRIESGDIRTIYTDSATPSPLAHEIINARPYAFLDDAPLEERRTRAVYTEVPGARLPRTASCPVRIDTEARQGDEISDDTIAAVKAETLYPARNENELYDLITQFALVPEAEVAELGGDADLHALVSRGKVFRFPSPPAPLHKVERGANTDSSDSKETQLSPPSPLNGEGSRGGEAYFISADKAELISAVYTQIDSEDEVAAQRRMSGIETILLAHLELLGPLTAESLAARLALPITRVTLALSGLEAQGSAFVLHRNGLTLYVERTFYQRLQHYGRRRSVQKRLSPLEYLAFLAEWQHVSEPLTGPESLAKILRQLQGAELSLDEWNSALRLRITDYNERMLEDHLLSGEFFWWRAPGAAGKSITRKTRYMLLSRDLWHELGPLSNTGAELSVDARRVRDYLERNGASFVHDIHTGRPGEAQPKIFTEQTLRGLRELVAQGLVTSDQFFALRRLAPAAAQRGRLAIRRMQPQFPHGRFSLVRFNSSDAPADEDARLAAIARLLLSRHGVVYRYAAENDFFKAPWPRLVRTLRLMEMAGHVRSGRFIDGLWGEQFATPTAAAMISQGIGGTYKDVTQQDPIAQVRQSLQKLGALAYSGTVALPA
ncbi:DEAD/DEAH box helicase [Turneriella parva]|uniref:ATP dependent helicase, Lhr family n=1 Tax=Turneriella parva (strain ATCC BAA-1111 / DSM 21527 / NCTC 11395 / H) TaxID=869212 RepID=I4BBS3_TURPD|nr:DEAD/DEAH box helicase [Turneriella parva]AFM14730.1 ATP dependent helicase, Lhr family [Turneriella parva DSM 21527]